MFTGIVTAIGGVVTAIERNGGIDLRIAVAWNDVEVGESIAVDGACLTIVRVMDDGFVVHIVATTIGRTRFGEVRSGDRVNLERALRASDRLGGHFVQGHVDGVGRVTAVAQHEDARLLDIAVPADVAAVAIPLGSITIEGVALTVNARPAPEVVQVSLIPFTLEATTLGTRRVGDRVHVEGDLVGKYLRQFAEVWRREATS